MSMLRRPWRVHVICIGAPVLRMYCTVWIKIWLNVLFDTHNQIVLKKSIRFLLCVVVFLLWFLFQPNFFGSHFVDLDFWIFGSFVLSHHSILQTKKHFKMNRYSYNTGENEQRIGAQWDSTHPKCLFGIFRWMKFDWGNRYVTKVV